MVFAALVALTRYVSAASIGAAAAMPAILLALRHGPGGGAPPSDVYLAAALAAFIAFTHRSNLSRLRRGRETPDSAPLNVAGSWRTGWTPGAARPATMGGRGSAPPGEGRAGSRRAGDGDQDRRTDVTIEIDEQLKRYQDLVERSLALRGYL